MSSTILVTGGTGLVGKVTYYDTLFCGLLAFLFSDDIQNLMLEIIFMQAIEAAISTDPDAVGETWVFAGSRDADLRCLLKELIKNQNSPFLIFCC